MAQGMASETEAGDTTGRRAIHQDGNGGFFGLTADAINKALGSYKPKGINTPGATTSEQTSKLREAYTAEIKDITTAGAEFRKQLDADVKAGIATLESATKERATSYDSQAKEVEAAGQRYIQAIRGVHGKGAGAAQTKASDQVAANNRKAINDEINGKRADLQKLNTLNQELAEAQAKSDESLNRAALQHSNQIVSEQQQRGILSPEQAATVKYQNATLDIAVQLDALQQQLKAITGNDAASVKRRADLKNQIAGVQQHGQFETEDYKRQAARFPEAERQRSEQNQVDRDKERTQELEQRQQLELASHVAASPADIHQDAANVLQSRLQENADETRALTDKLDSLISAIVDANPGDAAKGSLRTALFLILDCGLRPKEIVSLKVTDVDLTNGIIRVQVSKTKAGKRLVPMTDRAKELLSKQIGKRTEGWLFPSPRYRGKHIKRNSLSAAWRVTANKAGVSPDIDLYCARHTFATDVMRATKDPFMTMKLLGHTELSTTERYQHPNMDRVGALMNERNQLRHISRHTGQMVQ